eukprot:11991420-Alexandrium_andersonii.AAC.2
MRLQASTWVKALTWRCTRQRRRSPTRGRSASFFQHRHARAQRRTVCGPAACAARQAATVWGMRMVAATKGTRAAWARAFS